MPQPAKVASLDEAFAWLDRLERSGTVRTVGAWPLAAVLDHLAQSVEMSLDGYPQARGAWFQHTVGAAAFAYFKRNGAMRHGLADPIPGAPALSPSQDWRPAAQRLRQAIQRFQRHGGSLRPHFAYGALSRDDFARAHALHIANHQDEIVEAA
jgi:hypothetical protein